MNIAELKSMSAGRLQFYNPAPEEEIAELQSLFPRFDLAEYISFLRVSNGAGEVYSDGNQSFVHNMLVLHLDKALEASQSNDPDSFLVIGWPGTDGILFGLKPERPDVYAYMPIDNELVWKAKSVSDLVLGWIEGRVSA